MDGKFTRPLSNLQYCKDSRKVVSGENRIKNELKEVTRKYQTLEIEHEALKLSFDHLHDVKAQQENELVVAKREIELLKLSHEDSAKRANELEKEIELLK